MYFIYVSPILEVPGQSETSNIGCHRPPNHLKNIFYFACKSSLIAAMNRYLFLFKNNLCGSNNLYMFALLTYLNLFITPLLEVCDSKKTHENHKMVICHETEWLAASIYCCMKFFAPLAVNLNVIIKQQLKSSLQVHIEEVHK